VACAILRVRVEFAELYVFYTVLVSVFSPLLSLLAYPESIRMLAEIKETKAKGLDLTTAAVEIFKRRQPEATSTFFAIYDSISVVFLVLITFAMMTYLVHVLSSRYLVARPSLVNAIAFGLVIGVIPGGCFQVLYVLAIYAFL
jgi:hypothetical protein